MTKKLTYIAAVLYVAVGFFACTDSGINTLPTKISLNKGDTFTRLFTRTITCDVESPTMPYHMVHTKSMKIRFEVKDTNSDGSYLLNAYMLELKVNSQSNEGSYEFDSNEYKDDIFPLMDIIKVAPLGLTMHRDGSIDGEHYPDDFFEQIKAAFPSMDIISLQVVPTHMNGMKIGEHIAQSSWLELSADSVSQGGVWKSNLERSFAIDVKAQLYITHNLARKNGRDMVISSEAPIKTELTQLDSPDAKTFYQLEGSYKGEAKVNSKSGMIAHETDEAHLEGTVSIPSILGSDTPVPAKLSITSSIETVK